MNERHHVFSILTPVYDPPFDAFMECVRSVREQTYPHWEWLLVNDHSTATWVASTLDALALEDPRIVVQHRQANGGISAATNDALAAATGEFVVLLDHDDMLAPGALGVVNHTLWQDEEIDYVYSDEDKIGTDGEFFGTFPKPAWSPERLLCQNYCCHLSAIRRSILVDVGGFRSEFDGAQDYDVVLRVTEAARRVVHVPEVLYHWRIVEGSTAGDFGAKPYAVAAGQRAVAAAMERRGVAADVVDVGSGYHRVRRHVTNEPLVSIVVPTRGGNGNVWGLDGSLVLNMLDSLRSLSTYRRIEVIVVYDTDTPNDVMSELRGHEDLVLVPYEPPFNFSKKCNLGAVHATGDILIFVNDDIEVKSHDWIERLITLLEEPDVGAVGPMLLLDNFCIQSAGHLSNPPSHFAAGESPSSQGGPGIPLLLNREVSGVTGACLAVRRETFEHVGGFSIEFPLNYNDVDFCFKLTRAGYRIIWTPDAQLFHFESMTRETEVSAEEAERLVRLWGRYMLRDPYLPFAGSEEPFRPFHAPQTEWCGRKPRPNRLLKALTNRQDVIR